MQSVSPSDKMKKQSIKISWLNRIASDPKLILSGWLITALSVVLAVYFYQQTQVFPELSYLVSPSRTTVFKKGETSRVTILIDSQKVQNDVSSMKVGIWNRGNKPIKMEDVLKRVTIKIDTNHPIYDAKIVKQVRDVSNMRLDLTSQKLGLIGLSWDILEKDDGGVVQIVYGGNDDFNPDLEGIIIGQPKINKFEIKMKPQPSQNEQMRFTFANILGALFMIFVLGGAVYIFVKEISKTAKLENNPLPKKIVTITGYSFALGFLLYVAWIIISGMYNVPRVPFDL